MKNNEMVSLNLNFKTMVSNMAESNCVNFIVFTLQRNLHGHVKFLFCINVKLCSPNHQWCTLST